MEQVLEQKVVRRGDDESPDRSYIVTLKHDADFAHNEWQVGWLDKYESGGGFGYSTRFGKETEARSYFAELVERAEREPN